MSVEQKEVFKHLIKRVALDKETITYRILSRELGITVASAKTNMEAFLLDPQAKAKGVVPTWLCSGTLSLVPLVHVKEDEEMDVDDSSTGGTQPEASSSVVQSMGEQVVKTVHLLVAATDLEAKLLLFSSPPSKHVYSLSPAPLHSLVLLTGYQLALIAPEKWKAAPAEGYGGIVHPDGERRKRVDIKGKGKVTATTKSTISAASTTNTKGKAIEEKKVVGKVKGKEVASAAAAPAKAVPRPIGALRGLFAKQEAAPPPVKKRQASPPPPAKKVVQKKVVPPPAPVAAKKTKIVSNGIFGDEEVSDDEFAIGDDEMDAMREMEEEMEQDKKKKDKAEKIKNLKIVKKGETTKEKETRELALLMMED